MADAWGGSFGVSWGVSWGSSAAAAAAVDDFRKHGAGFHERTYAPPHTIVKRKPPEERIEAARDLYKAARAEIPEQLQAGLVPLAVQIRSKRVTVMPAARNVDFEKFASDIQAIRVLALALQDARARQAAERARIVKRRREEDQFLAMVLEQLD